MDLLINDRILKPLLDYWDDSAACIGYFADEIADCSREGKQFRVTRKFDFPPAQDCSINHICYDPAGRIELHARVNDELIKEEATQCRKDLPEEDAKEANFRTLWWLDKDGQLVRRFFESPEQVFRFMALKVLNRFEPELLKFIES